MNSEASELYSSLGEERLSLIFEAAPSGMIMVDELGRVVLVNSQVERFVLASSVDITEGKLGSGFISMSALS